MRQTHDDRWMDDCIPLFIHNGLWKGYFIQWLIDVSSGEFDLTYFVFDFLVAVEECVDHLAAKIVRVRSAICAGVFIVGKDGDACGEVERCAKEPNSH